MPNDPSQLKVISVAFENSETQTRVFVSFQSPDGRVATHMHDFPPPLDMLDILLMWRGGHINPMDWPISCTLGVCR